MAPPTCRAVAQSFRASFVDLKTGWIDPVHSQYRAVIFEADQSVEETEAQECPELTEGASSVRVILLRSINRLRTKFSRPPLIID
jgi:hypothetical protein